MLHTNNAEYQLEVGDNTILAFINSQQSNCSVIHIFVVQINHYMQAAIIKNNVTEALFLHIETLVMVSYKQWNTYHCFE